MPSAPDLEWKKYPNTESIRSFIVLMEGKFRGTDYPVYYSYEDGNIIVTIHPKLSGFWGNEMKKWLDNTPLEVFKRIGS